jgi:hypothetical protein
MTEKFEIKVKINHERPDFRVFASYFFGNDFHSYDSDGDSFTVTSRNWTELYMCFRENADLSFEIWPISENPLIVTVSSERPENAYRIAYFLARETNGVILDENNEPIDLDYVIDRLGHFDLETRLIMADKSI